MAKKQKQDLGELVECKVLSPLKYDGERHEPGAEIALPQRLYDDLAAIDVVGPLPPKAAAKDKPAA